MDNVHTVIANVRVRFVILPFSILALSPVENPDAVSQLPRGLKSTLRIKKPLSATEVLPRLFATSRFFSSL